MARKARRDTYSFIEQPPVKNEQDGLGEAEGVTSPKSAEGYTDYGRICPSSVCSDPRQAVIELSVPRLPASPLRLLLFPLRIFRFRLANAKEGGSPSRKAYHSKREVGSCAKQPR